MPQVDAFNVDGLAGTGLYEDYRNRRKWGRCITYTTGLKWYIWHTYVIKYHIFNIQLHSANNSMPFEEKTDISDATDEETRRMTCIG